MCGAIVQGLHGIPIVGAIIHRRHNTQTIAIGAAGRDYVQGEPYAAGAAPPTGLSATDYCDFITDNLTDCGAIVEL